jgi:hypothetical protein
MVWGVPMIPDREGGPSIMSEDNRPDEPPRVPDIERRIAPGRARMAGVLLLMVLPALAIAGVLNEARRTAESATPELLLRVEYPHRLRADAESELRIEVVRAPAGSAGPVLLRVEGEYLDRLESLDSHPGSRAAGEMLLDQIEPGEGAEARLRLAARRAGVARGVVTASAGEEELTVRLRTRVLP